jgi:hypothetical protein
MSKASEEALGELHGHLAVALTTVIKDGAQVLDREGEVKSITAPASYFAAAIALLKNNNITADPTRNADLADLEKQLSEQRQSSKSKLLSNQAAFEEFERQLGDMTNGA